VDRGLLQSFPRIFAAAKKQRPTPHQVGDEMNTQRKPMRQVLPAQSCATIPAHGAEGPYRFGLLHSFVIKLGAGFLLLGLLFVVGRAMAGATCDYLPYQNQCQGSNLWPVPAGWSADSNDDCQPEPSKRVPAGYSGRVVSLVGACDSATSVIEPYQAKEGLFTGFLR
jgi:hypothetical protein